MRRVIPVILVVILMTMSYNGNYLLDDIEDKKLSSSSLTLNFSNGPNNNEDVTGLITISIGNSGSGTISSMVIEISSDNTTWNEVVNLTTTPWLTYLDTTAYTNDSYVLRVKAYDSDVNEFTSWYSSGEFNIVNQVPVITSFTLSNTGFGTGESALSRAWYNVPSNGTLSFTWTASDDDLSYASLVNVPGPGNPSNDGPTDIEYGWEWSSGNMQEGTYNPRITVYDNSGLSASKTMFIGIDRTAPTMSTPTIGDTNGWSNTKEVTISNILDSADDGSGSGVDYIQYKTDDLWIDTTDSSLTLNFEEGEHTLMLRAVDIVGNVGSAITVDVNVDTSVPIGIGWTVPELSTSQSPGVGVNVSFSAEDLISGIDNSSSKIQFGFDLNGVGSIPDQSGRWIDYGDSGLEASIVLASWISKSRQYLMLRAVVTDNAGNELTTIPASYQILPGKDLWWNSSQTNLDRLVVRPGDTNGKVVITSMLEANEDWTSDVTVILQAAPADRTEDVEWTTMKTQTILAIDIQDECKCEQVVWNYTVPNTGQWDIRLVIDPNNILDERDEANNNYHLVVTGASVSGIGVVSSFAPSIYALLVVGFTVAIYQKKKATLPPN